MRLPLIAASILVFANIAPAAAADICGAVVLHEVAAVEDPTSKLRKGEHDSAITQYRVNKKTGDGVFCSHGGYCYPRYVQIGGQKVEALRLTNCRISSKFDDSDADDRYYEIDVDRSKNSASRLRRDDVDNKLLEMGMCSACAGNATELYLSRPKSRCAKTVRSALEGDPSAIATLKDIPEFCESR